MAPATGSKDSKDLEDTKKTEEETVDQKALVSSQVDFYFSDFNLQVDKYLRTLLEASDDNAITVDQLLTFKKIKGYVDGDRSVLVDILKQCATELQYAHYDAEKELIYRNPEKPFTFTKHFFRAQSNCVVHLSKLPKGCNMATIRQWSDTIARHCSIQPIKAGPEKSIRSALVVFQTDEPVKSVLASAVDNQIRFTFQPNTEEDVFKVLAFDHYRRLKNKARTKARKARMIRDFANLSLSDKSTASTSSTAITGAGTSPPPKPKAFGNTYQVAKRSLLFECGDEPPMLMAELKTVLSIFEVIYVYAIGNNGHRYYVLFKNRTALSSFIDLIKEKPKEVTLQMGEESKAVLLSRDFFQRIDPSNLPSNFEQYSKRIKAFFRKNDKTLSLNIEEKKKLAK